MPFVFVCPFCHNKTKVLDRFAGQTGPCVGCGKSVTMPKFNEHGVLIPSLEMHIKTKDKRSSKRASGWMPAIVASAAIAFVIMVGLVSVLYLWPNLRASMQRVAQGRDFDNMRAIAKALNAYSDRYGTYPTPIVVDPSGRKLYSWRVLILPFLGYEDLYKKFELSQPWDSPANTNLLREMPTEYASPNSEDAQTSFETNYVLVTGAGTLFPPSGPLSPAGIDKPTLLLVETQNNNAWCAPGDIDIGRGFRVGNKPMVDVGGLHRDSFTAMTVDEESMRFPSNVPQTVLDALITPNGGENVQTSTFLLP